MNEKDFFWIKKCREKPDDYVITLGNDCAFVTEMKDFECVHEFEHYGWQLALDLFLVLGCNAEEA